MSIAVTVNATGKRTLKTIDGFVRYETITVTGLTAGADNTVPHGLGFTPTKIGLRPAKDGSTPGGWSETGTVPADATNIYVTVNTNGSTKGQIDVME
jgi:hypothetical protein